MFATLAQAVPSFHKKREPQKNSRFCAMQNRLMPCWDGLKPSWEQAAGAHTAFKIPASLPEPTGRCRNVHTRGVNSHPLLSVHSRGEFRVFSLFQGACIGKDGDFPTRQETGPSNRKNAMTRGSTRRPHATARKTPDISSPATPPHPTPPAFPSHPWPRKTAPTVSMLSATGRPPEFEASV